MTTSPADVAILGAGPYGLAAAAYLSAANGLDIRVYGEPMDFWERQMPRGMLLRSPYVASSIGDPWRSLMLDDYQSARGRLAEPVPLDRFVDYGRWFQEQAAPDLQRRRVSRVGRDNGGFRLDFADGGTEEAARRVVVAAGIAHFAFVPDQFRSLPQSLVSHTSDHSDLGAFRGRQVAVVGGGQSALESAALLHEAGAEVEVIVRQPRIFFLRRVPILHGLGPLTSMLFHPAEVGPAGISQLVGAPGAYRRLPRRVQDRFAVRSLRPAGAAWLRERLADVAITLGRSVTSVRYAEGGVVLELDDGTKREVDHVLLATGYRVDIARYEFLEDLAPAIDRVGGFPRLSAGFESSVSGLYFVGAPAAWSFGPLMRFVAGTEFAGARLAAAIVGRRAGTR
jgi:cation diffusion facilitator CzcD-associated flavoprotein CzcO